MNNSHERFERRKPGGGGSKEQREESLEELLRRMSHIAGLEIETVAQTTAFVLERALNRLFELQNFESCAALWPSFTVEVKEILQNFRETIDEVEVLQNGAFSQSNREVLQLRAATSKIAQKAATVVHKALGLADQIMRQGFQDFLGKDREVSDDPTRATLRPFYEHLLHTLHVSQVESYGMLQLFTGAQDEKTHPTVLDLLAGCSFQRCWILPHEDYETPLGNAPIVISPESAAGAVLLSLTALESVHASLFGECIRKPTAIDDGFFSLSDAQEVFKAMSTNTEDARILALRSIAEWGAPMRAYIDGQGNAVVSLLLPYQARIFERRITQELDEYMKQLVQAFNAIQLTPLCSTRALESGFELSITLPIPTLNTRQQMRAVTNKILEEHLAMTENMRARTQIGSITFQVQHGATTRTVQLVRNLFETREAISEEEESAITTPLALVTDALQLSSVFNDATYLDVDGSSYMSYMVTIGRDIPVSQDGSASEPLGTLSSRIDQRLQRRALHDVHFLDKSRAPICRVPLHLVADRAFSDEIARLSKVVSVERLDLSFLIHTLRDYQALSGSQLVKNLRELIELDEERLSEHENPRLHALAVEKTYKASVSLHFYLSGSDGSLCGVGTLPLKGGIADLSVFPKSVATKCGQLVNAIASSVQELQNTEGPWTWRLHQELLTRNFALSDELVQELYEYRKRSFSELTPATIAELLYSRIAEAPSRFLLSDQFRLTEQSAFTLSVLTPEDMEQWRNQ
jgi:hypothetical protein